MPAQRVFYELNPLLQYWNPCVDPTRAFFHGGIANSPHESPPAGWPDCLVDVIDTVARSRVGRALVQHLRRRTTIYYARNGAQGDYDLYGLDDSGEGPSRSSVHQRVQEGYPAEAVIYFDPLRSPRRNEHWLIRTPDISMAHELVHALGITHGLQPNSTHPAFEHSYNAPSQEEGHALVIENMYRSELRLSLRRTYLGDQPVWDASALPPMQHVLAELTVRNYQLSAPSFATEMERLSRLQVPYNPFRDYRVGGGVHRTPRFNPRSRRPSSR